MYAAAFLRYMVCQGDGQHSHAPKHRSQLGLSALNVMACSPGLTFACCDTCLLWPQVVKLPNVEKTLVVWDWSAFQKADLWAALLSFLYLDFLDCTGTLFSMATYMRWGVHELA